MAFNIGGSFDGGYGDIAPGYKNPLGDDAPSVKGDYDWGSMWGQEKKKGMWDKLSTFNSLFDKTRETDKWQDYAKDKPFGGEWSRSNAGQVLENLGVVYPQQHSPMYIPGMPGQQGKGSAIGKAAGLAIGLAAAPFTGGASLGAIPFLSGAGGTVGGVFD